MEYDSAALQTLLNNIDAAYASALHQADEERQKQSRAARDGYVAAEKLAAAARDAARAGALRRMFPEMTDPFGQWLIDHAPAGYQAAAASLLVRLPLTLGELDKAARISDLWYVWPGLRRDAIAEGVLTESPVQAARREFFEWVGSEYGSISESTREHLEQHLDAMCAAAVVSATDDMIADVVAIAE